MNKGEIVSVGFLKGGGGFDWNGNGNKDHFDRYMDMKASGSDKMNTAPESSLNKKSADEAKGISMGGKPLYDSSKDSNGVTILKCLIVIALCAGGIFLPAMAEMGAWGIAVGAFAAVGLSLLILKNT